MKEHIDKIMNGENKWDEMMETNAVEGSVKKLNCQEIAEAMQKTKSGKATRPVEESVKMITASGEIGYKMMMGLVSVD